MKKVEKMKKSFSMIELIFVIVVVSILSIVSVPNFNKDTAFYIDGEKVRDAVSPELIKATNQVLSHIRYTRHLALIDNKFQPYPLNGTTEELDRSNFWFKQRWQIQFHPTATDNRKNSYSIYSDYPSSSSSKHFDKRPMDDYEIAKDPLTKKYLSGYSASNIAGVSSEDELLENVKLIKKFGINKLEVSSSCGNNIFRILFDNMGKIYCNSDNSNTGGDNPYKYLSINTYKLTLCKTDPCSENNLSICIAPETGYSYICK